MALSTVVCSAACDSLTERASCVHFTGKWISEECVDGSVDFVNQPAATAADSDIAGL